ncbi:uncharacterized protein LOC127463894 isoform X2 [Manacus candei]|uniref:uncharacterized protein LOC127463894 isoform X2 n=1 Tax=Manacus candei TaxID=415023 RepID=UPI002227A954|nr:uncharacterized protein LOC127463894 isoform X2 [Manacus candei]
MPQSIKALGGVALSFPCSGEVKALMQENTANEDKYTISLSAAIPTETAETSFTGSKIFLSGYLWFRRNLHPCSLWRGGSGAVGGPAWTLAGQQELCVVSPLIWEESSSVWNFGSWTAHFGSRIAARCSWWASQGSPWAARALCAGTFCLGGILLCIQFWDLDWQFQCRTPASEQQPFLPGAVGGPAWTLAGQQELCVVQPLVWEESSSVWNFGSWTAHFGSRIAARCSWWASQGSPWAARALCAGTFCLGGILVCIQFWDLDWQFQCRTPASEQQPFLPGKKVLTLRVSGAVGGPARAVHGQQELSVLAPFVWEESSSVFNSGTWTGNFSAGLLQANNSPFSQARKCLPSGSQVQLVG